MSRLPGVQPHAGAPVTAVILTMIKTEFRAAIDMLADVERWKGPDGTSYRIGRFDQDSAVPGTRSPCRVVVCQAGRGQNQVPVVATAAFDMFKPEIMLLVGCAGGRPGKAEVLDVIVPNFIDYYELGNQAEAAFRLDTRKLETDRGLFQTALDIKQDAEWQTRLRKTQDHLVEQGYDRFKCHREPTASGDKVIASTRSALWQRIETLAYRTVGVEMEGFGFYEAFKSKDVPVLMIRGVSDCLDDKNETQPGTAPLAWLKGLWDDPRQDLATRMAMAFALQFLSVWTTDRLGARHDQPPAAGGLMPVTIEVDCPFDRLPELYDRLKGFPADFTFTNRHAKQGSILLRFETEPEAALLLQALHRAGLLGPLLSMPVSAFRIDTDDDPRHRVSPSVTRLAAAIEALNPEAGEKAWDAVAAAAAAVPGWTEIVEPMRQRAWFFEVWNQDELDRLAGQVDIVAVSCYYELDYNLAPLSGLISLQMLNLKGTDVTDLSPLSGLINLKMLNLCDTGVTDLAPLSGLTSLQMLDLNLAGVTDLSPLSGLTSLQMLDLNLTGVTDLSPLSRLTSLQRLDLNLTGVTDLSPLSRLTSLQTLNLDDTDVRDLSPLSGFTSLQTLNLDDTGVRDLSPLSGLTSLQTLHLNRTGVMDLSPLSGLTSLQRLDLNGTGVRDLSPLSGLASLRILDLNGTGVSDLSPLSGLTSLQRLDLSNTGVMDLSPLAGVLALRTLRVDRSVDVSPLADRDGLLIEFPDD